MTSTLYRVPCRIWISPRFPESWRTLLMRRTQLSAQVRVLGGEGTWTGPAILLLSDADLRSGDVDAEVLAAAAPARPVIVGGTDHRDLLLQALNDLRAFRVLRSDASVDEVIEALRASHDRLELDATVDMHLQQLREETTRLDAALAEVSDAKHEFLHAERLSTIGRLFTGLLASVRQHAEVMRGLEQTARQSALPEEASELLDAATESSGAIERLLDELERFSRGNTNDIQPTQLEDVDTILRQVHEFVRFDELAQRRRVLCRAVSGATVRADRYALYQVLLNLVRNALQATREGGLVELHARQVDDRVELEVLDNGSGVLPELRSRLFEGFVSTKGEDGTGLGLHNCRRVVEAHGGELAYFDRAGDGSRFVVRLPVAVAPDG